jgi:hypothetical protein
MLKVQDIEERKEIIEYLLRDLKKNSKAEDTNKTTAKAKSENILKLVRDGRSYLFIYYYVDINVY